MIHEGLTVQRPWRLAVGLLVVLGLTLAIPGLAQSGRGTLTGSVKDSTGANIPGASLELTQTNTGSQYKASASGEGLYTFPELQPGTYSLAVTYPGFQSYTQNGITVYVGSTATVNVALQVGAATQSVTVTSDASQLQTESSDVGFTMTPQVLEALPLPFGGEIRNPLEFAALAPGFAGTMTTIPLRRPRETSSSAADSRAARTSCSTAPPPSSLRRICRSPMASASRRSQSSRS